MNILEIIERGVKLRLSSISFCIGIGTDQITPEFYVHTNTEVVGYIHSIQKNFERIEHRGKVNSKSLKVPAVKTNTKHK